MKTKIAALLLPLALLGSPALAAGSYNIGSGQNPPAGTPVNMTVCPDPTTGVVSSCAGGAATQPYQVTWIGHQYALSITSGAAVALTPTSGATIASIIPDSTSGNIRCTYDGTAPTTANGQEILPDTPQFISVAAANMASVQCIAETATNATLNIQYGK